MMNMLTLFILLCSFAQARHAKFFAAGASFKAALSSMGLPGIMPADTNAFNEDDYLMGHKAPLEKDDNQLEDPSDYDTMDGVDQENVNKKGESWIPGKVLFKKQSLVLNARARAWLDEQIPFLSSGAGEIEVMGHAWEDCPRFEDDLKLSLKRAYAVINYLHVKGKIPLHRMRAHSFGRYHPLAEGKDNPGLNRRVNIKLIKKPRK